MRYTLGVLVFVVALLLSVMLHEFGHFATAKRYGMKATRFFVGFGPTLWSTRRGETEYGVKAIPAGGFVKIVGMTPLEELEPGDEGRAFYRQPPGERLVVLAAGSVMHFIIAVLILFGVLAATQKDPIAGQLRVQQVNQCITAAASGQCTSADPAAPALGQLQPGDVFVSANGQGMHNDGTGLSEVVSHSIGNPVTIVVERGGHHVTLHITPAPVVVDGKRIGRIGVQNDLVAKPVTVAGAVPRTFTLLGTFFTSTVNALGDLPHQVSVILKGQPRENGAASVVDIARVSGQIAEAHVSIGERIANLLLIVAQVNFFVGLFNLLPLLPLDGGHIAILGFEQGRRRVYHWFGR